MGRHVMYFKVPISPTISRPAYIAPYYCTSAYETHFMSILGMTDMWTLKLNRRNRTQHILPYTLIYSLTSCILFSIGAIRSANCKRKSKLIQLCISWLYMEQKKYKTVKSTIQSDYNIREGNPLKLVKQNCL